jgi:hypothetical protein
MKKYLVIFTLIICFACGSEKPDSGDLEVILAKSSLEAKATDLFEQIKVIPLETTDSSLVGGYVGRIEIWDNKIFLLNELQSHKNILCFDLSGKFLFKIDKMGQGPGEYTYLDDIFIDKNLNHVVFMSENRRTLDWNMQGVFLYSIYSDDIYYARHTIYLNDSTYLSFNDGDLVPKDISLIYLDSKTMNIRHKSNSINEYFYSAGNKPLSINNDKILCLAYSDTIFDISDMHNVYAKYVFYYSNAQSGMKKQLRKNINKWNYEEQLMFSYGYWQRNESVSIVTMYETGKYLAFTCRSEKKGDYVLFYDKENKKVYDSENIDFGEFKLDKCAVLGMSDESLYCVLYDEITDEDKKKIKNSKVFSEADKKVLLEHKDEDNPVILILK